jgi:hypothetical protein
MLFAAVAGAVAASATLAAQSGSFTPPRTSWGDPDLQGIWNGNDLQGIPFQRAEDLGTRDVLTDEELAQRIARRDGLVESDNAEFDIEQSEEFSRFGAVGGPVSPPPHWLERSGNLSRQASFLVDPPDGRLPDRTAAAEALRERQNAERRAQRQALGDVEANSYTDRSNYDRCISLGPMGSLTPKIYNSGNRIVQGPGWVAFSNEMIHETRVIPTDGRSNVDAAITGWMGNSVGRFEGDTLVVETRNLKPESNLQGVPLSDEGVMIERFRLVADDTLEYRLTVDDPTYWTEPWTMMMVFPRDDEYGFYEYACHEGNYTMSNILSGARAEEAAPAAAAPSEP